ncbi:MAG: hypothetical protein AB7V15_12310, partial [Acidimicrobiia bacterium]
MTDLVLAAPEQTSLATIDDQMAGVEAWVEQVTSIPELQDAGHQLTAIAAYLEGRSRDGLARVEAAKRRVEARIGDLLGPTSPGRRPSVATEGADDLSKDERHEFREMAEHPDVVEEVIAASTDDSPPSRRKVTTAIKDRKAAAPTPDDAEVALIVRRRAITEQLVRLERAWEKVAAHPVADFDKRHVAALRVLGRVVLRAVARLEGGNGTTGSEVVIDVSSSVADDRPVLREPSADDELRDPIAETRRALEELGSKAEVPDEREGPVVDGAQDEIVEEEAMLGSGSPSSTSFEEGGTEVPDEPVDPPDEDPEAASADAPPSSSVEPAGAPEVPTGDPDPIAGFASAVEAAVEAPGEPGSPFVVFLDARQTLIRGPRSDVLVDAFEDAKAVLVDWLAGFVADKAPRLDELVEEHWDAVDDDARERAVGAMRGILRAGAALAHRSLPGGLDHYLKLDPRPATTHRGSVLDVHVNEITALL